MAAELDGLSVGGRNLRAHVDKTTDSKLAQHGDKYWEDRIAEDYDDAEPAKP